MTRSRAFSTRRMIVIAAAVAVLPAAADAQTRENNKAVHAFISAVDLGEIQQSMVAHERASSPEVHQFASMMIADHSGALHSREARLGQQNQGLLGEGMTMEQYRAAGQGPLSPVYGPGNGGNASGGSVPEGQKGTSTARASDGVGVGNLSPTYGPGNGRVETSATTGQAGAQTQGSAGAHAGHGDPAAMGGAPMPPLATLSSALVTELEAALRQHEMSRALMESNARNLAVLQGVSAGPQFDVTYMDAQVSAHRYALGNLDRMIAQGGVSEEMMGIMQATRATVAAHLQQAEGIRARLPR